MALNAKKSPLFAPYFPHLSYVTCFIGLITLSGDAELNPGRKYKATQTLSICHWNLNSICAHNFAKLSLLRAYVSIQKFDILACQRHILIPVLTMRAWKSQNTT